MKKHQIRPEKDQSTKKMIPIYKNERSTESNGLYKLLPQTNTQIIEDSLSTKSVVQERKKMKIRTERREKLSINNKKHIKRKQNTLLRSRTLSCHKNKYIRSHYKSNTITRRETNNIHVENYKSNETEL